MKRISATVPRSVLCIPVAAFILNASSRAVPTLGSYPLRDSLTPGWKFFPLKSHGRVPHRGAVDASPQLQIFRYAVDAADPDLPSTTYASSSFTRYRNGFSPVSSPDAFLPFTRPQIVSTARPNMFNRIARFISLNSADPGSSIFDAIVTFALSRTVSDLAAGRSGAGSLILVRGAAALARSADPRLFGDGLLPDFAEVAEFDLTIAGVGANAAGVGSAGRATATLSKQGRAAQPRKYPRDGANQPKPTRIPASTPTKSSPIRFPSLGSSARNRN